MKDLRTLTDDVKSTTRSIQDESIWWNIKQSRLIKEPLNLNSGDFIFVYISLLLSFLLFYYPLMNLIGNWTLFTLLLFTGLQSGFVLWILFFLHRIKKIDWSFSRNRLNLPSNLWKIFLEALTYTEKLDQSQSESVDSTYRGQSIIRHVRLYNLMFLLDETKKDFQTLEGLKSEADTLLKQVISNLAKQGVHELDFRNDVNYIECLDLYKEYSSKLTEKEDRINELEVEIQRVQNDIDQEKEQDIFQPKPIDLMSSSVAIYIDIERQFKTTEQLKSYVKSFLSTDVVQLSEKMIVLCLRMVKLNEIIEAYGQIDENSTEQRKIRYKEDTFLYTQYMDTVIKSIQELDDLRIQLARYEFRLGETEIESTIDDLRLNLNSIDQGLDVFEKNDVNGHIIWKK